MRSTRLPVLLVLIATTVRADDAANDDVLVRVDGRPITAADLEFEYTLAGVPEESRGAVRKRYLEKLVEARLLERFLRERKVEATKQAVDLRVLRIRTLLGAGDRSADDVLKELGLDDDKLREKLATPVAWDEYSRQVVRPDDVRKFWAKYQDRYDGTRIRARQILIKVPRDAADDAPEVAAALEKLRGVREKVADLERDFGAAARELSQAPSAEEGGDLGTFPYRGRMPTSFTKHVFGKKVGELAGPFRSPFGVHLVQVTEVVPGDYSLEDVRDFVFDELADEVRGELMEKQREAVEIEWLDEATKPADSP